MNITGIELNYQILTRNYYLLFLQHHCYCVAISSFKYNTKFEQPFRLHIVANEFQKWTIIVYLIINLVYVTSLGVGGFYGA